MPPRLVHLRLVLACVVAGGLASQPLAQTPPQLPAQSPAGAPVAQAEQLLSRPELDALVAPIALYPDTLLAQVLMASTYPLEVVQADRWLAANKKLTGDALKAAAEQQPWDASVKALVATPSVLEMMSKNLDWTQKLGDAVLAQQPDLMDGVQRMRTRAYDAKKLSSGSQQTVSVRQEDGRQAIVIEPAQPDTIYVPYYDPAVVYGSWPYPANPPYYFPAPGYIATGVVATGLAFGAAYALGRWNSGSYWGGNVNWNNNNINIDRNRVTHWQHNPQHRHGVQYRNNAVQQKFAGNNLRAGSEGRMDFRGRSGDQVLQPGGDRGNLGAGARPEQRPGDRPNVADRSDRGPGDRAGAGNRPEQRPGDRAGAGSRPDRSGGERGRPGGDAGRGGAPRAATQPKRPNAGAPRAAPARDSAFGNVQSGRSASLQSQRGHASMARAPGGGGRAMSGGGPAMRGGGGAAMGGGGGGGRVGGGGGGGRGGGGGGGRRSDIQLKHEVVLLGRLDSGIGFYRFAYNGSQKAYVGVIAQEVRGVAPWAVSRGANGYLRVDYRRLGVPFQTFERWRAFGARVPAGGQWP